MSLRLIEMFLPEGYRNVVKVAFIEKTERISWFFFAMVIAPLRGGKYDFIE